MRIAIHTAICITIRMAIHMIICMAIREYYEAI